MSSHLPCIILQKVLQSSSRSRKVLRSENSHLPDSGDNNATAHAASATARRPKFRDWSPITNIPASISQFGCCLVSKNLLRFTICNAFSWDLSNETLWADNSNGSNQRRARNRDRDGFGGTSLITMVGKLPVKVPRSVTLAYSSKHRHIHSSFLHSSGLLLEEISLCKMHTVSVSTKNTAPPAYLQQESKAILDCCADNPNLVDRNTEEKFGPRQALINFAPQQSLCTASSAIIVWMRRGIPMKSAIWASSCLQAMSWSSRSLLKLSFCRTRQTFWSVVRGISHKLKPQNYCRKALI